jgi:hypothetical protein
VLPNNSYVLRVRVGRPGPYVARSGTAVSAPVLVQILPKLRARLVGARVVGAPLAVVATLHPSEAGRLRVRVIRKGKATLARVFAAHARVNLGTSTPGSVRVEVEALPRIGYAAARETLSAHLRPQKLQVGAQSTAVGALTRRLAELHYATPSLQQTFGYELLESVYAFQKVQGLPRTGAVDAAVWSRLDAPHIPQPRYGSPADHIEISKAQQVLYIVRGGKISLISPVSTAGIAGYYTPVGRFAIYRKVVGYDPSPLGVLLNPMYFVGGYAIHGSPSVPPYPASHGCVRVPNWVIARLFESEPYGETVYVY